MHSIKNGTWVTMITPYTKDNEVDYDGIEKLIEWYIKRGVDGIFALCQSSEMFFLTSEERLKIAKFIIDKANSRIDVIVSGHVEEAIEEQIEQLKKMAELKPDAIVLISNRLVLDGDDKLIENLDKIASNLPSEIPLGIYECPYPFKRLLTDEEIEYMSKSDRYVFLKDTCCNAETMKRRAKIVKGTSFKLYNANTATLIDTLRAGYSGYCGVMANIHPDLYAWLYKNIQSEKAKHVNDYLSMMSAIEYAVYPRCAKRYLRTYENININDMSRSNKNNLASDIDYMLRAVNTISEDLRKELNNEGV